MTYRIEESKVIAQAIADTSTEAKVELGTIVSAYDPTYGYAQFIYLKGVASTVIGDVVNYRSDTGATVRGVLATRGPVAVAMSANVANQYGWYQISGMAVVKAGTVAANGNVYLTATDGTVDDAVTAGSLIQGARFKTADGTPSAGFALAQLARPSADGLG